MWGKTATGESDPAPIRVEEAWPALVSREMFDAAQQAMRDRAPTVRKPGRVGSKFLLSGLLRCGVCGRPYSGQGAKSGQFAYYICGSLFREGAGACSAPYLNAPRVEDFVVEKIKERILTEETIVELVTLVAEEIDAMAGELSGRLEVIDAELGDVRKRLERLYEALETSELTLEVCRPVSCPWGTARSSWRLRERTPQLSLSSGRWSFRPRRRSRGTWRTSGSSYGRGPSPSARLIRNFVQGIEVVGDEATLTYTIPMPSDGMTSESASVLDFVQSGPPHWTRTIQSVRFVAEFFDLNYLLLQRLVYQRPQRVSAKPLSVEEVSGGKRYVLGFRGEAQKTLYLSHMSLRDA